MLGNVFLILSYVDIVCFVIILLFKKIKKLKRENSKNVRFFLDVWGFFIFVVRIFEKENINKIYFLFVYNK